MTSVVRVVGILWIGVRVLVHLRTSPIVTVRRVSDGLAIWALRVGWVGRRDVLGRRRGVGRCHGCRNRRRVGRMFDQIHFGSTVGIPKVDREDIIGCIDLTNPGGQQPFYLPLQVRPGEAYLMSISFPVCSSCTIRRMHGGGVIGLRSWRRNK